MKKFIVLVLLLVSSVAQASEVYINMQRIRVMESSGDPKAYNSRSQARGLYQITPIVLKEWNNFHSKDKHTLEDLFLSEINSKIAHWYMNHRIPQMLRYFKCEDTVENRLISYNAGINYVVRDLKLPSETVDYICKYNK